MCVSRIPDSSGGRTRRGIVQFHTHNLLLQTLPRKCIDSRRLHNFCCSSLENSLAVLVGSGNTDNNVAVMYGSMLDCGGKFISGKDYSDTVSQLFCGKSKSTSHYQETNDLLYARDPGCS